MRLQSKPPMPHFIQKELSNDALRIWKKKITEVSFLRCVLLTT